MIERVVIIGAGQAGVQAVASLRADGFAGAIALVGDEPFPPYQRPPLSKAYLAGTLVRERLFLKPDSFFVESACDLRLGVSVARIDRGAKRVHLGDGSDLAYDKLLFATGARVRKFPIPGADLPNVHYLRGIADVDLLQPLLRAGTKLAIVGAGYVGLEVAAVAVKHGLDVTVIEAADRVMARSASAIVSAFYENRHRAAGVKFVMNASAQAFEGQDRAGAVRANDTHIAADFILVGIGVVPNVELARDAGLACDDGIVVDEHTRTMDPDIYAAGDCTNHPAFAAQGFGRRMRLESVQNAIDQAKVAALGMVGRPATYREVPWFWSDQYDLKLQIAGIARANDVTVLRGSLDAGKFAVFHLRDGIVSAVEAVNAGPEYIVGRKLIAEGKRVEPERLADLSVAMKSLV